MLKNHLNGDCSVTFYKLQYSHIHDFSRFINSNCQVVLLLSSDQQIFQGCACTLHP